MKLNPCIHCKDADIVTNGEYVYCTNASCDSDVHTSVSNWNKANPIDTKLLQLQQAMLQSLIKRYAVNGKISDVGMPIYDRECLTLLEEQGVLSLSNGLYQTK